MTSELKTALKKFFEENTLAKDAANSISNGRKIKITITDSTGESTAFVFTKEKGANVLKEEDSTGYDVSFVIPVKAAEEITSTKFDSVGQVGLRIFEKILSSDAEQKIQVKVHAGVLSLITGGYLGVLTAGGGDVAKFLASKGLGNIGKIKDAISKMKQ